MIHIITTSYGFFHCNKCKWSEWAECSTFCGRGMKRRRTLCALSPTLSDENQLKTCKELGLKKQDFEHLENCNTWNKKTCPR